MASLRYTYMIDGVPHASIMAAASVLGVHPKTLRKYFEHESPTCHGCRIERVPLNAEKYEQMHHSIAIGITLARQDRMRYGGGLLPRVEVCP